MQTIFALLFLAVGAFALEPDQVTGTTPPPVDCPDYMCNGKADGNYEYDAYYKSKSNYFLQCVSGLAYCQACFPLSLVYSKKCDACMYSKYDECYTTKSWTPPKRFPCPDICPKKGHKFSGNLADYYQPKHFVSCWRGMTMGCVNCPAGLLFNEYWNACLYDGKYKTEPLQKSGHHDH